MRKTKYGAIPSWALIYPDDTVRVSVQENVDLLVGMALPNLYTADGDEAMEIPGDCLDSYPELYKGYTTEDIFDLCVELPEDSFEYGVRVGYYGAVRGIAGKMGLYSLLEESFGPEATAAILDLSIHCLILENLRDDFGHDIPPECLLEEDDEKFGHMGFSFDLQDADWYECFLTGRDPVAKITEEGMRHFLQAWQERARDASLEIPDNRPIVEDFSQQNILACVRLMEGRLFLALRRDAPLRGVPLAFRYCPGTQQDEADWERVLDEFQAQGISIGSVLADEILGLQDFQSMCAANQLEFVVSVSRDAEEYRAMVANNWNQYPEEAARRGMSLEEYLTKLVGLACSQDYDLEEAHDIWSLYTTLEEAVSYLTAYLRVGKCSSLQKGVGLLSLCFCTFIVSIVRSVLRAMSATDQTYAGLVDELYELACVPVDGACVLVGKPETAMKTVLKPLGITKEILRQAGADLLGLPVEPIE